MAVLRMLPGCSWFAGARTASPNNSVCPTSSRPRASGSSKGQEFNDRSNGDRTFSQRESYRLSAARDIKLEHYLLNMPFDGSLGDVQNISPISHEDLPAATQVRISRFRGLSERHLIGIRALSCCKW